MTPMLHHIHRARSLAAWLHRARTLAHHRRTHKIAVRATVAAESAHLAAMALPVLSAVEGVVLAATAACALLCALSEEV